MNELSNHLRKKIADLNKQDQLVVIIDLIRRTCSEMDRISIKNQKILIAFLCEELNICCGDSYEKWDKITKELDKFCVPYRELQLIRNKFDEYKITYPPIIHEIINNQKSLKADFDEKMQKYEKDLEKHKKVMDELNAIASMGYDISGGVGLSSPKKPKMPDNKLFKLSNVFRRAKVKLEKQIITLYEKMLNFSQF